MEEKSKKVVKMKAAEDTAQQTQGKLSYEKLNEVCGQLYQQNQQMQAQLQQMNMTNLFKRLDYLFKVLECADVIKDSDFINNCVDEIKLHMTPASEEKDAEKSQKD